MARQPFVLAICLGCLTAGPAYAQVQGSNLDDLAKELSNPGAANATLNNKFEYRWYGGDLPGAGDQESLTYTFQPVLPFVLPNGDNLIFRPAFSYVWDQPLINAGTGAFAPTDSFGDIPFDLLYATQAGSWTLGAGVVGTIPTGTDVSGDNWLFGPSLLAVNTQDWGVWGIFPFHHEKIGGDGADFSVTSLQYFLFYSLPDGWQIGTGPTITYDWNATSDQAWTVPVGLTVAKTTAVGGTPVKMNLGLEYSVVRPDSFGTDWKLTFTVSPVIKNPFQR